jgi:hypothetical protein
MYQSKWCSIPEDFSVVLHCPIYSINQIKNVRDHLQTNLQIIRNEAEDLIPDIHQNLQDVYNFKYLYQLNCPAYLLKQRWCRTDSNLLILLQ